MALKKEGFVEHTDDQWRFSWQYLSLDGERMPLRLCNASATFQRCICENNLDQVLVLCIETDLVLNWEKFHLMVNEGIVLGYKISLAGTEVDKFKVSVIKKMTAAKNEKIV
ncbi:uncharacterized protein LOC127242035 [Andrographis paniculata]|uniref:uncharacterized protein LOC127242035 n=1 Tax=Andrographis paniculata TaxID=175694 RepID=UPI0021E9974D|nr:uncharacterized protein LOC127242035 [Andrographis paniculata]